MTGWVWAGIFIGLAIVVLAVGTPYLITHKGMRSPDDRRNRDEARAYFRGKRRWQRNKNTVVGQPEKAGSKHGPAGSPPHSGPG
jgi:hypothetical protein